MKITDIRVHLMNVPRPDGSGTARNWMFVEVESDEGITGIGEATTEYHEQAIRSQIETELKPRLLGMDPTNIERIWQLGFRDFWWRRGVVHTSAMSGIDQALWDIAGKAANVPVFRLLGGKTRDRVRCYVRSGPELGHLPLEEAARTALQRGFDAFKHGRGKLTSPYDMSGQVQVIAEDFALLRQVLGPKVALMLDAGGMFDLRSAYRIVEALRPLDMHFVEELTNMDTVEPTLRLKQQFPDVPIALGERLVTRWDCRPWFEAQALDVCQVDISHAGGISELMKIAHFAEIYGITIAPHNPYGPVALAACAHFAAAVQNFDILEHCHLMPWFEKIQADPIPIVNGHVEVGDLARRPGLGVELDMDLLKAHAGHTPLSPARIELADGSTPLT